MTRYKKLLSVIIVFAMVLSFTPSFAMAEEENIISVSTAENLAEAFAAGGQITLQDNIALSSTVTIPAGKAVTLDLAGFTVSGTCNASQASMIVVSNTATLTIKDSSEPSTGKITYASGSSNVGFALDVKGNLILESGTIELTGGWSLGFAVDVRPNAWGTAYTEPTTFVMNGGKIDSSDTAVRVDSNSSDTYEKLGVYFTMNGGVIDSGWDAIFIQHRYANNLYVTINNGDISGDNSPFRIYGDTVISDVFVEINGGTFDYTGAPGGSWLVENFMRGTASVVDAAEITISGGRFESMDFKYVAEDHVAVLMDGYYVVHQHDTSVEIPAKDATCTETGLTAGKKCSVCGAVTVAQVVTESTGHTNVDLPAKEATCTETGLTAGKKCSVCGTVTSGAVEIPASKHSWSTDFQPGTDTHWQYCNNNCNTKQNEAAHTFAEKIDNVYIVADSDNACAVEYVKSCTVCGKGHATETFWVKKDAPEHTYDAGLVTTEPSCTATGVKTYTCVNKHCGHTKTETIPALNHTEVELPAKDATCTETGLTAGKKCSTCGTTIIAQIVIGAKSHAEVELPAKDATCTETGLTAGKKCSTCGTVTVEQTVIDKKGHFLTPVPAAAATYFAPGNIEYHTCSGCDALFADAEGTKEVTLEDVTLAQLVKIEDTTADVSTDVVEDVIKEATNNGTTDIVITVTQDKLAEDNKEETPDTDPDEDESTDTPEPPATEPPVVTKTQLPVAAVEQVAGLHEEATLTIKMTNATVTMDKTTMDVVTEKAQTAQTDMIALEIEHIEEEHLAPAQQAAVAEKTVAAVISASILVNDKEVHDFEGGKVTVAIPFQIDAGTVASDYVVLYIADDGSVEEIPSTIADGKLVMTLSHFSEYVVVNTTVAKDPTNPNTGDGFDMGMMFVMLVVSAAAIVVLSSKKRFVK